ncbi:endoplasmic reticulum mannosyl-oligosaccharide 1,2-alpha-mannosidase [Adelges cooleyi]|uniref:endoplasmic reticulum mannosyl-oligosaccharide 1,2-alpha-mannosidase n=1 Tax=Adelges cooleyi TaxID=133065 RepID=UPI0021803274|nr:endoplasmic reticulum mannosyl-oligosaccharide 1,2-alpha-mannosidase [Adelges cooleyi]XP_050425761.1 endoplasmic reticulum mannosyl-oligosaccharide 1,2-alpha-mannosidase [Adelges cooleyi]
MIKDHVSLNFETVPLSGVGQNYSYKSWGRRFWRKLSKLQKLIIYLCAAVTCISIYLWLIGSGNKFDELTDVNAVKLPQLTLSPQQELDLPDGVEAVKLNEIDNNDVDGVDRKEQIAAPALIPVSNPSSGVQFSPAFGHRQNAVLNAFKHAWSGYRKYAWGHDHVKPISKRYQDWFNLGLTIVDSLDTLWIMNMKKEFDEAREWVSTKFSLDHYKDVNLFETTIRVLGGFLSAYHFTGDSLFLDKALDVGERLLPCFTKSPSPIPYSDVNLVSHMAHSPKWSPDSSTAEVSTLQLEFRDLSRCVGRPDFEKVASRVSEHIHTLEKYHGLVPIYINPNTGKFHKRSEIKLGARGDSYYEYLLKQWIQTGKSIDYLKDDYIQAIDGIITKLVRTSPQRNLTYIGELRAGSYDFHPKMDHLVCYLPGTLALGVHHGMPSSHMRLAEKLLDTCFNMYADQPTFLSPEIVYFSTKVNVNPDMYVNINDAHNLLRPEFAESLWYMYQISGNVTYQDWGWLVFQGFERYTKVAGGYTSIGNVLDPDDTRPQDMTESFFFAETLKYLYLLMSDDRHALSIDKYVLNSEGHPLPVYNR